MSMEAQSYSGQLIKNNLVEIDAHTTDDQLQLFSEDGLCLCIVAPDKNTYSETFIRAHIENLPGKIHLLYGGALPIFQQDDSPLVSPVSLWRWFIRLVLGKLFNFDFSQETLLKKAI